MAAPVALFVYNRPEHTKRTIEALQKNDLAPETELVVYADGARGKTQDTAVCAVREYIKTIDGFKNIKIVERAENLGLADSIIAGVTEVINEYGAIIVFEDDLVAHRHLLNYMNEALLKYENEQRLFSITGFNYPEHILKMPRNYKFSTYFSHRAHSWSWATWKPVWDKVDFRVKNLEYFKQDKQVQKRFNRVGADLTKMLLKQIDGTIDSWAIRFCYSHFINNAYCLYPATSLICNIGFDNTGTHCTEEDRRYEAELRNESFYISFPDKVAVEKEIAKSFRTVSSRNLQNILVDLALDAVGRNRVQWLKDLMGVLNSKERS